MIKLPTPQFIVFYNGKGNLPDESECKLSDAFEVQQEGVLPALECRARVLNINYGHNQELMNTCKRLHDYAYFVAEVNKNLSKGYSLECAIDVAIKKCIKEDVLVDILMKCESEVRSMLLTEFNMRKYRKMMMKEGREEGRAEGAKRVNELNLRLAELNRSDDIVKAAQDKAYQEQLFKEFNL